MKFCPNVINIRRTKKNGSDRLNLVPVPDLAFIKSILINIDETVIIRMLGFHVKENAYCEAFKITDTNKRYCSDIKSKYVHFQLKKEGYPSEQSNFLLAFLPRIKTEGELSKVAKELCDIIEWLEIRQQINCIVFRFGSPRHQMDNQKKWQKYLEKTIDETKRLYTIGRVTGRIKHIRNDKEKCLTVSSAKLFDSINVS